tara:strand:- start:7792 stop:8115 length:324 start_codon:yes stop_codon:yes gene_type:complete
MTDPTDKELLELAAKATGVRVDWNEVHGCYWVALGQGLPIEPWNPLTDDGDAFRLAIKTGMDICFGANYVIVDGSVQAPTVNNAGDPYLATRCAIVREAADVGAAIP